VVRDFPEYFANSMVKVKLTTSHKYIPFSKSFLPSMSMSIHSYKKKFCIDISSDNLQLKHWDIRGQTRILYDPQFEQSFGSSLQLLKPLQKTNSNLLVAARHPALSERRADRRPGERGRSQLGLPSRENVQARIERVQVHREQENHPRLQVRRALDLPALLHQRGRKRDDCQRLSVSTHRQHYLG
jgi:hypothetical protein